MRQMPLRMDEELWERLDRARGDIPRERYVRNLVKADVDAIEAVEEDRAEVVGAESN